MGLLDEGLTAGKINTVKNMQKSVLVINGQQQ